MGDEGWITAPGLELTTTNERSVVKIMSTGSEMRGNGGRHARRQLVTREQAQLTSGRPMSKNLDIVV